MQKSWSKKEPEEKGGWERGEDSPLLRGAQRGGSVKEGEARAGGEKKDLTVKERKWAGVDKGERGRRRRRQMRGGNERLGDLVNGKVAAGAWGGDTAKRCELTKELDSATCFLLLPWPPFFSCLAFTTVSLCLHFYTLYPYWPSNSLWLCLIFHCFCNKQQTLCSYCFSEPVWIHLQSVILYQHQCSGVYSSFPFLFKAQLRHTETASSLLVM